MKEKCIGEDSESFFEFMEHLAQLFKLDFNDLKAYF